MGHLRAAFRKRLVKAADPSAAMRSRPRPKPARLGEPAGPRSLAGEKTRDFGREQFKPGFVRGGGRKVDSHKDKRGSTAHHKRGGGGRPRRQLSVPDKHLLRIARQNAMLNPAMQGVMGGPSIEESKEIIERLTGRPYKEPKVSPWTGRSYRRGR